MGSTVTVRVARLEAVKQDGRALEYAADQL